MAQDRELYATLIDEATELSEAQSVIIEGSDVDNIDGAAGKAKGILGFSFKNNSGNAVLPTLNPEGALPVTFDAGTTLRGGALLASGSQTKNSESQVFEIDLTAERSYTGLNIIGTATRLSLFRIAYVDDAGGTPAETDLGFFVCSSGQYNYNFQLKQDIFSTVGGTGDQKLRVYATPLDKESDIYAFGSVNEVAV